MLRNFNIKDEVMMTKITLNVDEKALQKAKRISNSKGKSLGKIFEEYINSLPEKEDIKNPSIREISNMLKNDIVIPDDIDYKDFIRENRYLDYLTKHSREQ